MTALAATPMRFTLGKARLHGELCLPPAATGLVVFVHGSGSSRHSPRNRSVAHCFNEMGLATLLIVVVALVLAFDVASQRIPEALL